MQNAYPTAPLIIHITYRAGQLGVELAAVAAGRRADGQPPDLALPVVQRVHQQELLGMHRVVQRQTGKLQVHADVQRPAGTQANRPAKGRAARQAHSWTAGEQVAGGTAQHDGPFCRATASG